MLTRFQGAEYLGITGDKISAPPRLGPQNGLHPTTWAKAVSTNGVVHPYCNISNDLENDLTLYFFFFGMIITCESNTHKHRCMHTYIAICIPPHYRTYVQQTYSALLFMYIALDPVTFYTCIHTLPTCLQNVNMSINISHDYKLSTI